MILQHNLTPVIDLGLFRIHLYGIIFVVAFFLVYYLTNNRLKNKNINFSDDNLMSMMGILFAGMIIGARLGYVFIYWGKEYLRYPLEIFKIQEGGLSYHGGLIGIILTFFIYCKIKKVSFLEIADSLALGMPVAICLGKIGHFMNGELWGRLTSGSWGILFSKSAEQPLPRHPVQIYEAFLEGLVVFIILNSLDKKDNSKGYLLAMFLLLSGLMRFITEFVREPDPQIGYILTYFTMGQLLSIPVIISGILVLAFTSKKSS